MKFIKWLFSTKSKSKKEKNEILLIVMLPLCFVLGVMFTEIFKSELLSRIVIGILIILFAILFIACILRLIDISDYKENMKIVSGQKKMKYKPVCYKISDIEQWILTATVPDTLYVQSRNNGKIVIIEVSFETKGKNGPFINKKIFINEKQIVNLNDIKHEILSVCLVDNDCIRLNAITEFNNPKNFEKILKNK